MPEIFCRPEAQTLSVSAGETILDALLRADIDHTHVCGGHANCSTCRIMILDGIENCSAPAAAEQTLAKKLDFPFHVRLACQTKVLKEKVEIRRMVLDQDDIGLVAQQLSQRSIGSQQQVALLVAGIRGEADFDEVNFPYDVVYVMSRYFQCLQRVVGKFGGVLNNYLGNRAIAMFGSEASSEPVVSAVWAALEMQQAMLELNQFLQTLSYQPLALTIGVHYGPVVLVAVDPARPGLVSPLGDAVNIATLVEAANKNAGTHLLISGQVYESLGEQVQIQRTGKLTRPEGDLSLIEVIGIRGTPPSITPSAATSPEALTLSQRVTAFMNRFKK